MRIMKQSIARHSVGDTLIEVLFALAAISALLTGGYTFAGRNLQAGRHAQERTEALKLAEGQVELLKASSGAPATRIFSTANLFCLTTADFADGPHADTVFGSSTLAPLETAAFTVYPTRCSRDTDSSEGDTKRYKISISHQASGVNHSFSVTIRWERLGGGRDEISVPYKVYQ